MDIKKDRKKNKKNSVNGKFMSNHDQFGNKLGEIDVVWKDYEVTPIKPFYKLTKDNKKVIVYANKKVSKSYITKVKSELSDNFQDSEFPEIVDCGDIEGMVSYPFDMNPLAFKKGLAKIAIGFSLKYGIKRTDIPLVLSIDSENKGEIKSDIPLVQYYPLSIIDKYIEQDRPNLGYYPTHTLILFTTKTNPKTLVCYIELFSTFQWYVVLNENYTGKELYEYYSQRISKEEDYEFEPDRRYYKERDIILGDLGITEEHVVHAFNKQNKKTMEEIEYALIQEEMIKQKYNIDFERQIDGSIAYIARKKMKEIKDIDDLRCFKRNLDLFFYQTRDEEEIFDIRSYRRYFIGTNKMHDYISELGATYNDLKRTNELQKYGHIKVNMLNEFIQNQSIKEKLKK